MAPDREFFITIDMRCILWLLLVRLPLSFFLYHYYYSTSSDHPIFTTPLITIFFFPFIFLLSLSLSFASFNFSIRLRPHSLRIRPANFSPLISVFFFSSFCFQRSYLAVLFLLVTFASTYYIPLLEWIHRLLIRSIFMTNSNFNIVWSTTTELEAMSTNIELHEIERPAGDQIFIDIQEETV